MRGIDGKKKGEGKTGGGEGGYCHFETWLPEEVSAPHMPKVRRSGRRKNGFPPPHTHIHTYCSHLQPGDLAAEGGVPLLEHHVVRQLVLVRGPLHAAWAGGRGMGMGRGLWE